MAPKKNPPKDGTAKPTTKPKAPKQTASAEKSTTSSTAAIKGKQKDTAPKKADEKKTVKTRKPATKKAPKQREALNKAPTTVLKVFVFGNGECGELGLGPKVQESLVPQLNSYLDPDDAAGFHVVQIACGGMHTIALTDDNKLVTWGVNDNGALGRDTAWNGGLRDVDDDEGSQSGEGMNPEESTPKAISSHHFPQGTKFVQVSASDSCSFALTEYGRVYGWGTFIHNEGEARFRHDDSGNVVDKQETPVLIPGLENITQIVCGINHALALDSKGKVWAWGCGDQNQLGRRLFGRHRNGLTPRIVEVCRHGARHIASGDDYSFAIDKNDDVWAWGTNNYGQTGEPKSAGADSGILPYPMKIRSLCGLGITVLDGGSHHAAAITSEGQCLVWGRIDGGQLGIDFTPEQLQDDTLIRNDERNKPRICLRPTAVPGITGVVHVGCGSRHTVFIDGKGVGYATGVNSVGQLGIGTEDDSDIPKRLKSAKGKKAMQLNWAGGGGQNSIVAGPAKATRSK